MSIKERIKGFWQRTARFFRRLWNGRHTISDLVKHKHRFVVLDTDTYKEKISFQLSGINIFVFLGVTALVLVFLTALLLIDCRGCSRPVSGGFQTKGGAESVTPSHRLWIMMSCRWGQVVVPDGDD